MLEENQVVTTEPVVTDNSIEAPITDNAISNEPNTNESATKEGQAPAEDLYKKSFGEDIDQDKVKNYIKKAYGSDVDISELTEREIKALKSGINAEKMAHEKAQRLSQIEKEQKDKELASTKEKVTVETAQGEQEYQSKIAWMANHKAERIAAETDRLVSMGIFGDQLIDAIKTFSNQEEYAFNHAKSQLDNEFTTRRQKTQEQNQHVLSLEKEKSYSVVQEKFKKDFESEPELKTLFDEFKTTYSNADEFEKFVIPQFKKVIEARDARLSKTNQVNSAKVRVKQAQTGLAGSEPSNGIANDSNIPKSPADIAKWLKSK